MLISPRTILAALCSACACRAVVAFSTRLANGCTASLVRPLAPSQSTSVRPLPRHPRRSSCLSASTSDAGTIGSADTAPTLPPFETLESYTAYLSAASGLPKGFATGTASGTFVPVEAPSMGALPVKGTVIYLPDGPTDSWAAVFTQNKFPGAPVKVGRARLASGTPLQAVVINNKVSNVCSGGDGVADAELVCEAAASALKLPGGPSTVLPSSTGVIGWRLPAKELAEDVVPKAVASLQTETALPAARDIMTTDRYPKLRSKTLSNGARIVGVAKGAGMIEPNMATMLCYVMTDATVDRETLQRLLSSAVDSSFNSISVDGDESTSDTAVLIASNEVPPPEGDAERDAFVAEFDDALREVTTGLAADLVRNGEGTGHVIRVTVSKFPGTDKEARMLGRWVVNSPLFKCAVSGNDPNTGRLAGAVGSYVGKFKVDADVSDVTLTLGGRAICAEGRFILEGDAVEKELSDHMADAQLGEVDEFPRHQKFVEVGIDFGRFGGDGEAVVLGSDLTAEYVTVNADYRS